MYQSYDFKDYPKSPIGNHGHENSFRNMNYGGDYSNSSP